jgi:arabinofuranan 3-O-arabinosyltransferase
MGGRALPRLAGPWPVAVSLGLAGLAMGVGTYLALYMPFHDVTEVFGGALRGWVCQLLCLPALARLVLALGQPGDGESADADPPSVRTRAAAGDAGGGGAAETDSASGAHAAPEGQGTVAVEANGASGTGNGSDAAPGTSGTRESDGAGTAGPHGAAGDQVAPVNGEANGATRGAGPSGGDDDRRENDPEEART